MDDIRTKLVLWIDRCIEVFGDNSQLLFIDINIESNNGL